jgi:tetratricopeptide (TPR) repeat protein
VALAKGRLERIQRIRCGRQTFDRGDLAAVRLHGEEEARPDRLSIEQHGAGAAYPVLATDVSAGEAELVAEEVAQQQAGFRGAVEVNAVDADVYPNGFGHEIPGAREVRDEAENIPGFARGARRADLFARRFLPVTDIPPRIRRAAVALGFALLLGFGLLLAWRNARDTGERVTSNSAAAVEAYQEGERALRRGEPEQAEAAFRRAVKADPAFARAHFRLALAAAWSVTPHEPTSSPADSAALRLADRLTARDRRLLTAHLTLNEGDPAAIRLLEQLTESDEKDAEAWYLLGEAYYHVGWFELHPRDRFRAALRRSISLDPGFTPAYLHLAEDAFFGVDSAGAWELVASLRQNAPASPRTAGVAFAYALSWGDSAERRRAQKTVDTASTLALLTAKYTTNMAPDFWRQTLLTSAALAHQTRHSAHERARAYYGADIAYLLRGRVREALALSDSGSVRLGCAECRARGRLYLALLGQVDSITGDRAAR